MANKLTMLRGLPASGKSTWALEQIKKSNGKIKRVNKDELRLMIDAGQWSKNNEKEILHARNVLVDMWLGNGFDVIVDDTGFGENHEKVLKVIADCHNAEFEVKIFDTSLLECIGRDSKRGEKAVGAKVIQRMYDQFVKPPLKEHDPKLVGCWICDIDGTIAKTNGRSNYDYTKVHTDILNRDVVKLIKQLQTTPYQHVFIVSGRESSCRKETEEWLEKNEIFYSELFMRQAGDNRRDSIIKREIYEANIKDKYNVLGVFDDRNQCVELWRELGLTVFQVAYGNF